MKDCVMVNNSAVNAFVNNAMSSVKSYGVMTPQDRQKLEADFMALGPPSREAALKQLTDMRKGLGGFGSETIGEFVNKMQSNVGSKAACLGGAVHDSLSLKPVADRAGAAGAKKINEIRQENADFQQRVIDRRINGG